MWLVLVLDSKKSVRVLGELERECVTKATGWGRREKRCNAKSEDTLISKTRSTIHVAAYDLQERGNVHVDHDPSSVEQDCLLFQTQSFVVHRCSLLYTRPRPSSFTFHPSAFECPLPCFHVLTHSLTHTLSPHRHSHQQVVKRSTSRFRLSTLMTMASSMSLSCASSTSRCRTP